MIEERWPQLLGTCWEPSPFLPPPLALSSSTRVVSLLMCRFLGTYIQISPFQSKNKEPRLEPRSACAGGLSCAYEEGNSRLWGQGTQGPECYQHTDWSMAARRPVPLSDVQGAQMPSGKNFSTSSSVRALESRVPPRAKAEPCNLSYSPSCLRCFHDFISLIHSLIQYASFMETRYDDYSLTGLGDNQIAGKTLFLGLCERMFLEKISIETVDWIKKIQFH